MQIGRSKFLVMKLNIIVFFLFIGINSFAQETLVFEELDLTDNSRLIGMYPHYDEEKTFEEYNFIIEDVRTIDSISKIIKKGKEIRNQSTRREFTVRLYDGDKLLKVWSFDPEYSYIRTEGKSYEFNAEQMMEIAKKFGFTYSFNEKKYNTKDEFEEDYKELLSDDNLLFVYKPNFKFEGKFTIKFPKSKKFKHPKAISQYVEQLIGDSRKQEEYRFYYIANGYNLKHPNQYTMTMESDYELYKDLKIKKTEKGIWNKMEYSATIFMKN